MAARSEPISYGYTFTLLCTDYRRFSTHVICAPTAIPIEPGESPIPTATIVGKMSVAS
jgi:hypothetical protein